MQSPAHDVDPRVAYSRLVIERDDEALSEEHRAIRFELGEGEPWRREFADLASDIARSPLVEAIAYHDGGLYVMVPASSDARQLCLAGKVPEFAAWADVRDCVLVRLLLNSCARLDGLTDPVNETGHFYRVVKREKNALRAFEAVVGDDLSFTIPVRSFAKKSYLAKANGGELPDKYGRMAAYKVNEVGAIVYSRDDSDEDYVAKSLKKFDASFFDDARGEDADKRIAVTKLGFLNDLTNALRARYGRFLKVGYAEMERTRLLEISASEKMKDDALSTVRGATPHVSYSSPTTREIAGRLAHALGAGKASKAIEPGSLNVRVVPDEVTMDDGYAVFRGEAVQQVTASVATRLIDERKDGRKGLLMEGVLKELAVKRDIASGRIAAFDWARLGIEEFSCARGVEIRLKRRRRGDEDSDIAGRSGRRVVRKEKSGETEDVLCICVAFLSIGADGTTTFSIGDGIDALDREWASPVIGDDGNPTRGKVACHMEVGGSSCDFTIADTGLFTIPNDLGEMISGQVESGELARRATGPHGFHDRLAPLYGIGAAWDAGSLWYYVGHSKRMNKTLKRASRLRRVDGLDDRMVDVFLGLLDVGFARLGQPSVYPIPIKYLNEYVALEFGYEGEQGALI